MKNHSKWLLAFLWLIIFPSIVSGGAWTSNEFIYKPGLGARGQQEEAQFDSGLERIDARLGKEIWVGDPNYGATLQAAVNAIGSVNTLLRLPAGTWNITDNFTIPANVTLRPERGAFLSVANTRTLTINSFDAGLYRVFSCTGTGKVVFAAGSIREAHPIWFGVSGTETPANNALFLQQAINSVQGTGNCLQMPPTATTIDLTASPHTLSVTADLNISGFGEQSILRCLPATITNFCVFAFNLAAGVNLTMRDLTIQGPDDPGPLGPTWLDYVLTNAINATTTPVGNVRLQRVKITGQWAWCIDYYDAPVGGSMLELVDCDLSASRGGIYAPNLGGNLKRLHFINSKFHGFGQTIDGTAYGCALYLDPNSSILIDGCQFYNIPSIGGGFQAYCLTMNPGVPEYCRIINSTFNNYNGRGILPSKWVRSEIINCRFIATPGNTTNGVQLSSGDVSIRDCTISAKWPITTLSLPANGSVEISNCTLFPAQSGIHCTVGNSTTFHINNVKIYGGGVALFGIYNGPGAGTDNTWYINNLYVNGMTTAGFKSQGHGASKYFLNNCVFDMNITGIQTFGGHSEAEVNDCRFLVSTAAPISCLRENSGVVRGRNNYFQAGCPNLDAGYQKFSPRRGLGGTIASANSVTISASYDSYHVTGTAQINSISLGGYNWMEGMIYFIADGAWSFGSGGNVRPKTTGVRNVNEVVALMYDPTTELWYEAGW